jgi:hypothetical protein
MPAVFYGDFAGRVDITTTATLFGSITEVVLQALLGSVDRAAG